MYHEVYTPERTHSGISLFGLFLQVYAHKDLGGINTVGAYKLKLSELLNLQYVACSAEQQLEKEDRHYG